MRHIIELWIRFWEKFGFIPPWYNIGDKYRLMYCVSSIILVQSILFIHTLCEVSTVFHQEGIENLKKPTHFLNLDYFHLMLIANHGRTQRYLEEQKQGCDTTPICYLG